MATVHNTYNPTATKHTSFKIIRSDSNRGDINTINYPVQDLADHCAWLATLTPPDASANSHVIYASASVSLVNFVFFNGSNYYVQSSVAAAGSVIVPFSVPNIPNYTLTVSEFGCVLQGGSGHSALPATMPVLKLRRNTSATSPSSASTVDSVTDSSGSVAVYEAGHALVKSGLAAAIGSNPIWLELDGEAGANSVTNLGVSRFYIKYYYV